VRYELHKGNIIEMDNPQENTRKSKDF